MGKRRAMRAKNLPPTLTTVGGYHFENNNVRDLDMIVSRKKKDEKYISFMQEILYSNNNQCSFSKILKKNQSVCQYLVDIIEHYVCFTSETLYNVSLLFNAFLIRLCQENIFQDNSELMSGILLGDDLYETCLKFLTISNYYEQVEINEVNIHYVHIFNDVMREYFSKIRSFKVSYYEFNYYYRYCLCKSVINGYKKRFFNYIETSIYKRQRQCIRHFCNFRSYPPQYVDYIQQMINKPNKSMKMNDVVIKEFVDKHRSFKYQNVKYESFKAVNYLYYLATYADCFRKGSFSVAPLCRISRKFILIDNIVLNNMMDSDNLTYKLSDFFIVSRDCNKIFTNGITCFYKDNITSHSRQNLTNLPYFVPFYATSREFAIIMYYEKKKLFEIDTRTIRSMTWKIFIQRYAEIYSYLWLDALCQLIMKGFPVWFGI